MLFLLYENFARPKNKENKPKPTIVALSSSSKPPKPL
jgi:hypothetical protein